jgi:hypothetical protein
MSPARFEQELYICTNAITLIRQDDNGCLLQFQQLRQISASLPLEAGESSF